MSRSCSLISAQVTACGTASMLENILDRESHTVSRLELIGTFLLSNLYVAAMLKVDKRHSTGYHIDLPHRNDIVDWQCEVSKLYQLSNSTLELSVRLLDKFAAATPNWPLDDRPLITFACIMLATSLSESVYDVNRLHTCLQDKANLPVYLRDRAAVKAAQALVIGALGGLLPSRSASTFVQIFFLSLLRNPETSQAVIKLRETIVSSPEPHLPSIDGLTYCYALCQALTTRLVAATPLSSTVPSAHLAAAVVKTVLLSFVRTHSLQVPSVLVRSAPTLFAGLSDGATAAALNEAFPSFPDTSPKAATKAAMGLSTPLTHAYSATQTTAASLATPMDRSLTILKEQGGIFGLLASSLAASPPIDGTSLAITAIQSGAPSVVPLHSGAHSSLPLDGQTEPPSPSVSAPLPPVLTKVALGPPKPLSRLAPSGAADWLSSVADAVLRTPETPVHAMHDTGVSSESNPSWLPVKRVAAPCSTPETGADEVNQKNESVTAPMSILRQAVSFMDTPPNDHPSSPALFTPAARPSSAFLPSLPTVSMVDALTSIQIDSALFMDLPVLAAASLDPKWVSAVWRQLDSLGAAERHSVSLGCPELSLKGSTRILEVCACVGHEIDSMNAHVQAAIMMGHGAMSVADRKSDQDTIKESAARSFHSRIAALAAKMC